MSYHDDLLIQATQLVNENPWTQASLRRGVSTAYYAVFHLLIAEFTANWNQPDLRTALGRVFDHGIMKSASYAVANSGTFPFHRENAETVAALRFVGLTYAQLQEQRHFADYNLTKDLDKTDALSQVISAQTVFARWRSIRSERIAQAYLVSSVVKHRN